MSCLAMDLAAYVKIFFQTSTAAEMITVLLHTCFKRCVVIDTQVGHRLTMRRSQHENDAFSVMHVLGF